MLVGKGGLFAHTGTTDCVRLEEEAENNGEIRKLLEAFAYKISREICASTAALNGKPDAVIITGGLAYSSFIVNEIIKRVSFLGKIAVYPGEDELAALAQGAMRVLEGKEKALEY
jgi:butyrate kinase